MQIIPLSGQLSDQIARAHRFGNILASMIAVALCSTLVPVTAFAASQNNLSDAQTNYQKERADCLAGKTSEDRNTCLKEAGAAFAEAKRGQLNDPNTQYQQNATLRCDALKDDDRQACERRMQGQGEVSGSVAAGGIFRELVIKEPAEPAEPAHNAGSAGSAPDDKK